MVGKKGKPVTHSSFYKLVRNPLYKGTIKKFGIVIKGSFDPIVPEILFNRVQAILKGKNPTMRHYTRDNPDFPLRRFVLNPAGKPITGYWAKGKYKKYPYYTFHLPGTIVARDILEDKFVALLEQYKFDSRHLNAMRKILNDVFAERMESQANGRQGLEKRKAEINRQIDTLIQLQVNGGISLNTLTERTNKLEGELEYLNDLLNINPVKEVNSSEILRFAAEILTCPHLLWKRCPITKQLKVQKLDFPNGVVYDGEKFLTPKISSIFRLKEEIDATNVAVVDSDKNRYNTVQTHPSPKGLLYSEGFWREVAGEIEQLREILALPGE